MAEVNPAWAIDGTTLDALYFRLILGLITDEGVGNLNNRIGAVSDDLEVTAVSGMDCSVAMGLGVVEGDDVAQQGWYVVFNDAAKTLTAPAADLSDPRIDIVVAQINDATYGAGSSDWELVYIDGTPDTSPTPPSTPDDALLLAEIQVGAGATALGTITDMRVFAKRASSSVIARVVRATDSSIANNAATPVHFPSVDMDDFGFWSSGANTKLVVPVGYAGLYSARAALQWAVNSTGNRRTTLKLNGTTEVAEVMVPAVTSSSSYRTPQVECVLRLDEGDYLEVLGYQNSGGGLNVKGDYGTYFVLERIGD